MQKGATITLITDWKQHDYYLGAIKGQIIKETPDANIIDIKHDIEPFNIFQAGFILRNTYQHFPEGSIHIVTVQSDHTDSATPIVIKANNHYFIGPDNGIFSLVLQDTPKQVISIDQFAPYPSAFEALNIFAPTACYLANQHPFDELGEQIKEIRQHILYRPTIEENALSGNVIYLDSYQNAITNISYDLFNRVHQNRKFEIVIQSNKNIIRTINNHYDEVATGEMVALFNSLQLLEIAIRYGNAGNLLGLSTNSAIRIRFK